MRHWTKKMKFDKKLTLNKMSIARLNHAEVKEIKAGVAGELETLFAVIDPNPQRLLTVKGAKGQNPQVCNLSAII